MTTFEKASLVMQGLLVLGIGVMIWQAWETRRHRKDGDNGRT